MQVNDMLVAKHVDFTVNFVGRVLEVKKQASGQKKGAFKAFVIRWLAPDSAFDIRAQQERDVAIAAQPR